MNETGTNAQPDEAALLGKVRDAWAEALGLDDAEEVPFDVNFLEAGGSSMLLIMLWEELNELTPNTLRMADLFQNGTVKEQVVLLMNGSSRQLRADAPERGRLLGRARAARSTSSNEGETK